jgi:hypothetical protein
MARVERGNYHSKSIDGEIMASVCKVGYYINEDKTNR